MSAPFSLRRLFHKVPPPDRPLRDIERRLAKEFVKRRLAHLFPELRTDPDALERAYQELGLESNGTVRRPDGEVKSYGLHLPGEVRGVLDQR